MNGTRQYRVAIIGVGAIANVIASALARIESVTLVAGCCRTEEKGRAFAGAQSCNWYQDADAMLSAEKPDVGIICTPSGTHLEAVEACARHRVNVLCEKPLEITVDRVRRMIEACDASGIRFGGIFPQRFNAANRAVHAAARTGRFGALSVLTGIVPWWRDDAYYAPTRWQGKLALDGGGALFNQSIHTVDLLQWFAAAAMPELDKDENPVDEVFAYSAVRAHDPNVLEVEDTITISLRFRNGALGQLLGATSMWPGAHRRLVVSGRDGSAEVVEEEIVRWQFRDDGAKDEKIRSRFARPTAHAGGSSNPMAISDTPHMKNIVEFFEAMEEDRDPMLTAREASKSVAIVEACYESARTGRAVKVPSLVPSAPVRR